MMSSETETLTFNEILQQEDYVICDSSTTSVPNVDWYWHGVFDAVTFSKIDSDLVRKEIECLRSFLSFSANQGVLVVDGFCYELQRAREMVAGTMKFLKSREELWGRRNRFAGAGKEQRELLEEVHDLFHEAYKASRKNMFIPQDRSKYNFLEKITLEVTEKTKAKVDLEGLYEKRRKPKKTLDFHTDEQIVAAAFYLASVEEKKGGILTRGSAIKRILQNTIGSGRLNGISDLIERNRIRIYYVSDIGEASYYFDTAESKCQW